ncbi:MAG: phage head closure protein [Pseudomonadota bacterium]
MIGKLNAEVTLLTLSSVADGGGGALANWTAGAVVWADIEELSSATDIAGDRSVRLRRIAATIRQRAGLILGGRVRFDGVDFDVTSIEDADDDTRVTLVCEETLA